LAIPTAGETTADRIWDLRKKGDITPEILATVPHIQMHKIQEYIDYATLDVYMFLEKFEEGFEDLCELDDNSETEDTVMENPHKLMTLSTFERQTIDSGRLACTFVRPPATEVFPSVPGSLPSCKPKSEPAVYIPSARKHLDESRPGQVL
jgi:hypothetical protein